MTPKKVVSCFVLVIILTCTLGFYLGKQQGVTIGIESNEKLLEIEENYASLEEKYEELQDQNDELILKKENLKLENTTSVYARQVISDEYDLLSEEYKALKTQHKELESEFHTLLLNRYFEELEDDIHSLVSSYGKKVGLSFYDINSGYTFSINGDEVYTAASTTKVPTNLVLFNKIHEGKLDLDQKLYYTASDYEGGTGILQNGNLSGPFDIMTLSEYTIVYSDNIATRMLRRYIRTEYNLYDEYDKLLGYSASHTGNTITPNDATAYLIILYENENDNPYYDFIIDNMKQTVFNDRMDRYIDNDLVAHKIGNYNGFVNDIGIVYADNPFILSVYTDNISDAEELIGNVTKLIFDAQNTDYPIP